MAHASRQPAEFSAWRRVHDFHFDGRFIAKWIEENLYPGHRKGNLYIGNPARIYPACFSPPACQQAASADLDHFVPSRQRAARRSSLFQVKSGTGRMHRWWRRRRKSRRRRNRRNGHCRLKRGCRCDGNIRGWLRRCRGRCRRCCGYCRCGSNGRPLLIPLV